MSLATRLVAVTAALVLAASSAHAFTYNQGTTYGGQGATSYGSTLTDPGSQIRNYSGADLTTPTESTTTRPEGFSFHFGSGPFGVDSNRRLAPPKWSTDPLYLEKGSD